ncbi:MAG: AraC family transcriptional regulator, partial [Flavobacteriaceae bacterium]|nr:AraC family transcriptional regulator [Flavobacteriaceae bacterium]
DRQFRKYSVKAIAHEVGFNTAESFSKAFFKFAGIKPSYFIKELNKK